jgi:hypothetical protein
MHVRACACMHLCMCVRACACVCFCVVCPCVHLCVYSCACVRVCGSANKFGRLQQTPKQTTSSSRGRRSGVRGCARARARVVVRGCLRVAIPIKSRRAYKFPLCELHRFGSCTGLCALERGLRVCLCARARCVHECVDVFWNAGAHASVRTSYAQLQVRRVCVHTCAIVCVRYVPTVSARMDIGKGAPNHLNMLMEEVSCTSSDQSGADAVEGMAKTMVTYMEKA